MFSAFLPAGILLTCIAVSGFATAADTDLAEAILKWREDWPGVEVKVPLKLFREYLLSRIRHESDRPPEAPVDWLISRVEYAARIEGISLHLRVRMHVHVLNPEKFKPIPLLPAGVAWQDVEVNGKKATLRQRKDWLILDNPGNLSQDAAAQTITVSARADLRGVGRYENYTLNLPAAPVAQTLLKVDSDEPWQVTSPRAALGIVGNKKDGTHGTLGLASRSQQTRVKRRKSRAQEVTSRLEIRWRRPQPPVSRTGRLLYDNWLAWHLDENLQEVRARLAVRIVGGERDALALRFPPAADGIKVTGPDVREVRISAQSATVHLKGRTTGATNLSVQFAIPWASQKGKTSLHGFGIPDGRLRGGALVVTCGTGGVVLEDETNGLNQLALWEVPEKATSLTTSPSVLAYSLKGHDWRIAVDVVSLAELPMRETLIDEADYTVLVRPDGSMMTKILFTVRNRNRQFLRLRVPDTVRRTVLARVSGKPVAVSRTSDNCLLIPLDKSVQTVGGALSFPVELVFLGRVQTLREDGRFRLALPSADIPTAQAKCLLYVPKGFEPEEWEGAFRLSEKLTAAVEQLEYGRGHIESEKAVQVKIAERERNRLLAYNYLRAAVEQYERQDLAAAEESAQKLITDLPDAPQAAEAKKLLHNIRLIKDQRTSRGRTERAAAQRLQQTQQVRSQAVLARQQELLQKGWEAARQGKERIAAAHFTAAGVTGNIINVWTEADKRRQDAALAESRKWLAQHEAAQKLNVELQAKKKRLLDEQRKKRYAKRLTVREKLPEAALGEEKAKRDRKSVYQKRGDEFFPYAWNADTDAYVTDPMFFDGHRPPSAKAQRVAAALFSKASAEFARGKYKSALAIGEKLLEHDPKNQAARDLCRKTREAIRHRTRKSLYGAAEKPREDEKLKRQKLLSSRALVKDVFEGIKARPGTELPSAETSTLAKELEGVVGELRREAQRIRDRGDVVSGGIPTAAEPSPNIKAPGRLAVQRVAGKGGRPAPQQSLSAWNVLLKEEIRKVEEGGETYFDVESVESSVSAYSPGAGSGVLYMDGATGLGFLQQATKDLIAQKRYVEAKEVLDRAKGIIAKGRKKRPPMRAEHNRKHWETVKKDGKLIHQDLDFIFQLRKWTPLDSYYRDVEKKLRAEGVNAFNVKDIAATDAEGRALARFLNKNVDTYVSGSVQDDIILPRTPPKDTGQDFALYMDGQILVRDRAADKAVAHALSNLRKNYKQKVTVNSRDIALSDDAVAALGIQWNGMRGGNWAVIDEGRLNSLLMLEQRRRRTGRSIAKGQKEIIPGTAILVSNGASLQLNMAGDDRNTFDVNGANVDLAHNRILVVSANGRTVVVRAGATRFWTDAPEAPEIKEVPMEIDVPVVGVPVRFEKVIVGPEDDLLIECGYKYKEVDDG